MSHIIPPLPFPEPLPPQPPEPPLPHIMWSIYRDADGQVMDTTVSQQAHLDVARANLRPGYSIVIVPGWISFMSMIRFGFVDVDDPAKPVVFDADKLKADGLTLADILNNYQRFVPTATPPEDRWETWWPIKKPTKAT